MPGVLVSSRRFVSLFRMTDEERIEQFIELCKRMFFRMQREGSWPWPVDETEEPDPQEDPITR